MKQFLCALLFLVFIHINAVPSAVHPVAMQMLTVSISTAPKNPKFYLYNLAVARLDFSTYS